MVVMCNTQFLNEKLLENKSYFAGLPAVIAIVCGVVKPDEYVPSETKR